MLAEQNISPHQLSAPLKSCMIHNERMAQDMVENCQLQGPSQSLVRQFPIPTILEALLMITTPCVIHALRMRSAVSFITMAGETRASLPDHFGGSLNAICGLPLS